MDPIVTGTVKFHLIKADEFSVEEKSALMTITGMPYEMVTNRLAVVRTESKALWLVHELENEIWPIGYAEAVGQDLFFFTNNELVGTDRVQYLDKNLSWFQWPVH